MMTRREFLVTAAAASGFALNTLAAEPERKWRVGVIGHTGQGNYGHSLDSMWLKLPETEIVAVADASEKGLAAAQQKLGVSNGFADYREMLAKAKPDMVAICPSPMSHHRDMALAAAESGARGIYMEKPFCRTVVEADEIIAACERHGVKLALAHRNRYHPALPVVARLVKEGAIGRLLEVRGRGKEDQRGGAVDLWILGSHVLNLAAYFTGKPLSCSAVLMQDGRPVTQKDVRLDRDLGPVAGNALHARFEMESGVPVYFDSIQNAGDKAAGFGLQLVGTKGLIDIRVDNTPLAHLVPGNPFQPTKEPRPWLPITSGGVGEPEPIADLKGQVMGHLTGARDLMAAIQEGRQPFCSAEEGKLTVEMITAVFASHVADGARVPFPLQERENALSGWLKH